MRSSGESLVRIAGVLPPGFMSLRFMLCGTCGVTALFPGPLLPADGPGCVVLTAMLLSAILGAHRSGATASHTVQTVWRILRLAVRISRKTMNPEHRRRVTADQQPDPDSTPPIAAGRLPGPPAWHWAGELSTAKVTWIPAVQAATTVYASRLCEHAAGRHLAGDAGQRRGERRGSSVIAHE